MYGPELFLFMCRMGAAAVGCRMDAVLFEEHAGVKCFSFRRTARPAVTPSVLDGSLRRGGEPPACASHWGRRRALECRLTLPVGFTRSRAWRGLGKCSAACAERVWGPEICRKFACLIQNLPTRNFLFDANWV